MDNLAIDYYGELEDMRMFCLVTDHPCGTATEAVGKPCQCENCQDFRLEAWLVRDLKNVDKPVLHLRSDNGLKVRKP